LIQGHGVSGFVITYSLLSSSKYPNLISQYISVISNYFYLIGFSCTTTCQFSRYLFHLPCCKWVKCHYNGSKQCYNSRDPAHQHNYTRNSLTYGLMVQSVIAESSQYHSYYCSGNTSTKLCSK